MAIGDAAGQKGLATYGDNLLVKDVDTALNQRGDDIAAVMDRTTALESMVGQPVFSVFQGTSRASLPYGQWTVMGGGEWATPILNRGVGSWSGGALTITKAGVYRVSAHAQADAPNTTFEVMAIQVTKNTTSADQSATTLSKGENWGGPDASANALWPLQVGDVLRVLVFQRSGGTSQFSQRIVAGAYNLTFSAEWVSA